MVGGGGQGKAELKALVSHHSPSPVSLGDGDGLLLRSCPPRSRQASPRTVLVVAAEYLLLYGVAAAVGEKYELVGGVATLREAARAIDRHAPALSLAVLEPSLSDATVEEMCAELCGRCPTTSVVGLFRSGRPEAIEAARRHGVRGFLDTTVTPEELEQALERVRLGGVAVSSTLLSGLVARSSDGDHTRSDKLLTGSQLRALTLVAEGYSSKEIARLTGTSIAAVNHFVERASHRLGANHRAHAVASAFRLGILS